MTPRQQAAIERFRRFLQDHCRHESSSPRKDMEGAITRFDVTEKEHELVFVGAEVELVNLPIGNLLRALDHQWWHVMVGRGGKLTVLSCPRAYEQFHRKRAFGMKFKIRTGRAKRAT